MIVVVAVKSALEGLDFSRFLDLFDIGLVMDKRNQVEATWLEIVDHLALFEEPSRFEVVDDGCYPLRAFRVGVVVLILVLALFWGLFRRFSGMVEAIGVVDDPNGGRGSLGLMPAG